MGFSIEGGSKEDFQIVIIVVDRLEQERAQLLALRKKVSDTAAGRRLCSAPSRSIAKNDAKPRP
ncbi:hypothetical protein [Bradyrhizobium neotropicale]|uniref:hypothetical protein n=1 Tax=Bradyrhizobium neotropicale TaxID=1497615 RepID=UPI001AD6A77A|nr:hypothetical protein [Bradyrhizobium neotropicale]MBO4226854.1 hypothetical protein [Bradyrhizobium neotropicale]